MKLQKILLVMLLLPVLATTRSISVVDSVGLSTARSNYEETEQLTGETNLMTVTS